MLGLDCGLVLPPSWGDPARLKRQEVLIRKQNPLRYRAILSEAVLMVQVGGEDVLRSQLARIAEASRRPNITVQVLRFAAGAHLGDNGGFEILTFAKQGDPPLGYIETLAGELFLESPKDVDRLQDTHHHLATLAMSPAESVKYIREKANE
jgi:hypothetical protein